MDFGIGAFGLGALGTVVAGLGFTVILRHYLPSYLTEKGKNLATREDIGSITHIVESIKHDNQSQLEEIRTQLQFVSGVRAKLKEREFAALVQFFETVTTLKYDRLAVNLGDLLGDPGTALVTYQESVQKLITDLQVHLMHAIVYCRGEKSLLEPAIEIVEQARRFRPVFRKHFGTVKAALLSEDLAASQGFGTPGYRLAVQEANEALSHYHDEREPMLEAMQEAYSEFVEALNVYLRREAGLPNEPTSGQPS